MRSSAGGSKCRVEYDSDNIENFQKEVRTWFSGIPLKIKTTLAECANNGAYRVLNAEHELNLSLVLDGDIPTYLDQDHVGGRAGVQVYWLLIATVSNGDPTLDAVERENGRVAWLKLIEGGVSFDVKIQLLEKRLENVKCESPVDLRDASWCSAS